jgi:hypothetical protein
MKSISFDIGIYNLAYCIIETDDSFKAARDTERARKISIQEWGILALKERDRKLDFMEIGTTLVERLHEHFTDISKDVAYVFIENQPVQKNPTMKSLQMIVFTFFMSQRYIHNPNMVVRLVSACNKLKVLHAKDCDLTSIKPTKSKYTQTKKQSVAITKHYLERVLCLQPDDAMFTKYMKSKKQDDFADSFLQAVYMIEIGIK